ncbi:hypothetical protein AB205_0124110, partial [Aquarana catesbeiana]
MLLLNSNNDLDETVCAQNRGSEEASMDTEDVTTGFCWGSIIPVEILHRVFRLLADSEGAVPILCRLSQVCRLWRQVASSRDLWRRVTVSRCCVLPGITDPPRTQKRVMKTIEALIQQRVTCLGTSMKLSPPLQPLFPRTANRCPFDQLVSAIVYPQSPGVKECLSPDSTGPSHLSLNAIGTSCAFPHATSASLLHLRAMGPSYLSPQCHWVLAPVPGCHSDFLPVPTCH